MYDPNENQGRGNKRGNRNEILFGVSFFFFAASIFIAFALAITK